MPGSAQYGGTTLVGWDQVSQLRLSQRAHAKNGSLLPCRVNRVQTNVHGRLKLPAQNTRCADGSRDSAVGSFTCPPAEPHCTLAMEYECGPDQRRCDGTEHRNCESSRLDSLHPSKTIFWSGIPRRARHGPYDGWIREIGPSVGVASQDFRDRGCTGACRR